MLLPPSRTLQLVLLGLLASACQRQAFRFQAPAAAVTHTPPSVVRPDSAVAASLAAAPAADRRLADPRSTAAGQRPNRAFVVGGPGIQRTRMTPNRNALGQPKPQASVLRKRPVLSENQLVALVLMGGGAVLTAAGLLLIVGLGGGAAVAGGILLGLLGLGSVLSWFYLRALGKAYQH